MLDEMDIVSIAIALVAFARLLRADRRAGPGMSVAEGVDARRLRGDCSLYLTYALLRGEKLL